MAPFHMITARSVPFAILIAIGLMVADAGAFNTQFLDDAPIARFNKKDIEIMLDTITETLDNVENGVTVDWKNPKTGHHGTVTPRSRTTRDGMECREVDIQNVAGNFNGRAIHLMCKMDGEWKAVTN